jgi:hypothetical protein
MQVTIDCDPEHNQDEPRAKGPAGKASFQALEYSVGISGNAVELSAPLAADRGDMTAISGRSSSHLPTAIQRFTERGDAGRIHGADF